LWIRAAVLFRGDGEVERLESSAPIVGMTKNWNCSVDEVDLKPGNVLVMFTDGVTEARNPAADEFGYGRLVQIIRACFSLKPASLGDCDSGGASFF
jgi:phosphoserine phosphatase RsbU/P